MRLNIGCGNQFKTKVPSDYVNVDFVPAFNPDVVCDLAKDRWPFPDNSMDEGICTHVMEHIGEGYFHFLQEMYRVAKPGAVIHCAVPHPRHDIFLNDPTHVRPITVVVLALFSKRHLKEQLARTPPNILTPFAEMLNVDFELSNIVYKFDADLHPVMQAKVNDDRWFCEKHFNNIVHEITFDWTVIK